MKQYIRYYVDPNGNSHLHTQDTPINFEPVEVDGEKFDVEIETGEDEFLPASSLLPLVARKNQQETPAIANVPMRRGEEKTGRGKGPPSVDPGKIRKPDTPQSN